MDIVEKKIDFNEEVRLQNDFTKVVNRAYLRPFKEGQISHGMRDLETVPAHHRQDRLDYLVKLASDDDYLKMHYIDEVIKVFPAYLQKDKTTARLLADSMDKIGLADNHIELYIEKKVQELVDRRKSQKSNLEVKT